MRPDTAIYLVAVWLHQQAFSTTTYALITTILAVVFFVLATPTFNYAVAPRTDDCVSATQPLQQAAAQLPCHCTHVDEVTDLRDRLDLAKAELKDSSSEIDLYILDLDAMRTQLAAETARADMASCKADVVSDKLFGLQRTLIAAHRTVAASKREAVTAHNELAISRDKYHTMDLEVTACRKQLVEARNEMDSFSASACIAQKELGYARAETIAAREASAAAEEVAAATRMELSIARADVNDISSQLKDAQATIAKLEARNDSTSARLKLARKELANLKADSGVLLQAYDVADAAAFVMAHAVRVAEHAQLREKEATFDNFKSIFAQKSMSEAQARHEVTAVKEKLDKLEDKYAQVLKHHIKIFWEQASLQMEVDKLRAGKVETELDNAKLTRTIAERDTLEKTVGQLTAEATINKENYERTLAVQKARVSEAEKETSRQINLIIAERDRAQNEAYDLSTQLKNLQNALADLRGEMSTLRDALRASEAARVTAVQQAECAALERSMSRPLGRIEAIALQGTLAQRDAEIEDLLEQMSASCPPRSPTPENSPAQGVTQSAGYLPLTPASSLELIDDRPLPTPPITPAGGVLLRSPEREAVHNPPTDVDDVFVSPPRPVTPAATTPMRIPVRIGAPPSRPSPLSDMFSSIPQAPVGPPSPIPRPSTVKPSHLGQSRLPRLSGTPRQSATIAQFRQNVALTANPAARSPTSVPLPASPASGTPAGTPARRRSPRTGPRRSNENENEALNATPRYFGLPMPRPAFSATSSPALKSLPSSTGPKKGPKPPQSAGPKKGPKER